MLDRLRERRRISRILIQRCELVHEHVRDGASVAGSAGEEVVAAGRDEALGEREADLVLQPLDPRPRRLRQLAAQAFDQLGVRLEGHQVGLREVAVVLRLFLRAERRRVLVARVEVQRLLVHGAAGLVDLDLPPDLPLDPLRREVEGVHVLELRAGAEALLPGLAHRDVDVETHRPLLHLRVGQAELDDRLPELLEEALRVLGRAQVGGGHDLDERRSGPVEVDERALGAVDPALGPSDVHGLRGVLLEVGAHDSDLDVAVRPRHRYGALHAERLVVLGDLVALGIVRVEVVLAVEGRARRDLTAEREAQPHGQLDRLAVRDRQRAGERQADGARLGVGRLEVRDRAAAEHLRARLQVDVDLEPNDRLPRAHRYRSGTKSNSRARSSAWPARNSTFSENWRPISCRPTGSPSERPHGMDRPGSPARFEGMVNRSAAYIASGLSVRAPSSNATVGEVGLTSTSNCSKAAVCSSRIIVRTFWAWP